MPMTPRIRKLALTLHVTVSVGWLGAVGAFLALAIAGLTTRDTQLVRAAYLTMDLTGWFVIVPLCLAALPTGLVMSLGTEWGVFRHYWVVAKLLITVFATILLLVHMQPVGHLARAVAETTLAQGELAGLRLQLVADAGAALVALIAATALSVYKPRGMTSYGRRSVTPRAQDTGAVALPASTGRELRVMQGLGIIVLILVLLFVITHLAGGGPQGH